MSDSDHHGPTLYVASLRWARANVARIDPPYILSLLDPGMENEIQTGPSKQVHTKIHFHDVQMEGLDLPPPYVTPSLEHAREIIEFGHQWDGNGDVLIHCVAGRNRSAAAGLALLCLARNQDVLAAANDLRRSGTWLKPNPLMIKLLDTAGEFSGGLEQACTAMGFPTTVGTPGFAAVKLR